MTISGKIENRTIAKPSTTMYGVDPAWVYWDGPVFTWVTRGVE